MGLIVILPFAAMAGWCIFAMARWLRQLDFGARWWRRFVIFACVGLALGTWATFFFEYKVANARMQGFPIPIHFATREKPDAPWIASDMPAVIQSGVVIANLLIAVTICLVPLTIAAFFKQHRDKIDSPPAPAFNKPP